MNLGPSTLIFSLLWACWCSVCTRLPHRDSQGAGPAFRLLHVPLPGPQPRALALPLVGGCPELPNYPAPTKSLGLLAFSVI